MCTGLEIALLAGAATSAVGQQRSAKTQSQLLQRDAEIGQREAAFEESRLREGAESLQSRQRTAAAKSGAAQSGSVLDVMRQSAEEAELEALNIQFGAEAGSQARLFEAKQVKKAANIGTAGTLLTAAGGFK